MKGKEGSGTIIKLIILVLVIVTIIVGKKVIDNKTYDFSSEVRESLNKYFSSGNTKDLDKIIKIIDENEKDRAYVDRIEDFASEEVEKMYAYVSNKYLCDKNNLNACPQALEEIKELNKKIDDLYEYKSKEGSLIINPSTYKTLQRNGQEKEKNIESVIKSFASKNAPTSEAIRLERCEKATECNCNNNASKTCQCKYNTGKIQIPLVCENKDYVPKE